MSRKTERESAQGLDLSIIPYIKNMSPRQQRLPKTEGHAQIPFVVLLPFSCATSLIKLKAARVPQ